MDAYTIKVNPTNNPAIAKFTANRFLVQADNYEYKNIDAAKSSPLAQKLFYLPFVKTVYIAQNFVAVEKYSIAEWDDVQEDVAALIAAYLNDGNPAVSEVADGSKKIPVTIYAESTPNPAVLKFVSNKKLFDGLFEYRNIDEAKESPLAQALFHFPFVKQVFFSENYISIVKYDMAEWEDITHELRNFLKSYVEEGKPLLTDAALEKTFSQTEATAIPNPENLEGTPKEIVRILDEYIKPAVAGDGGNIAFQAYDEKSQKVSVLLQGACSGCPSSTITLKNGIETMLKEMLPGKVATVEALNA